MGEITVDPKGVLKLLNGLKVHKAPGPDGLSARVLKECSSEIAPILAYIYNESLAQGNVPDDWRQANVAPVFKKGEKYDPANYRPVSLTCICCKTLEHIIVSNINKHLSLENILADCQHGFRSQRSCDTQLVQFFHDMVSNLDRAQNRGHRQTDVIILEQVESAKYLGITITDNLEWGQHVSEISSKATKTLGFLRRNLALAPQHTKEVAYQTLVRPQLEYAAPIWHPYNETETKKVEKVQKTAASWVCRRWHNTSSIDDILNYLDWPSLEDRRLKSSLTFFYKIHCGTVSLDKAKYLTRLPD